MSQTSWTIKHFDRLSSTQDKIKELVASGEDSGNLAIFADVQDLGRGRHGNQWVSTVGNLYTTLHFKMHETTAEQAGHYSFIATVSLIKTMSRFCDVDICAKWPNDILIDGKKVAGILLETELSANLVENLYIGIGVNIANSPEYATQLDIYSEQELSPEVLLRNIIKEMDQCIDLYKNKGFVGIRNEWISHAYGLGQKISARYSNKTLYGVFSNIDDDGALLLELECGDIQRIRAGEVHFE